MKFKKIMQLMRWQQMKKIKFYIDLNYVGTVRSEIIEFPDDATDEDINETYDIGLMR